MAIVVKGKMCLCKTSLTDWNPERVNGILFYDRYQDFVKLFSAKIPEVDFEKCFAQPVYNDETNTIEWFCPSMSEFPYSLQEAPDASAVAEKNRITRAIENAAKSLSDNDRKYLAPVLLTLQSDKVDSITYHNNGQVVFGIWGMIMKNGKVINDVIIDDIKDHRTHHVTYETDGKGTLSFTDIVRRHGHVLGGESDIPTFQPAPGYLVKAWLPESPSGIKVDKPLHFTIVFEKDPAYGPTEPEEPNDGIASAGVSPENPDEAPGIVPEPQEPAPAPVEPPVHKVRFFSNDHGWLHGQTEFGKKEGERIFASEVPHVEAKEGYRFVGWDKQPMDYIVNGDIDFIAQYEPVEKKGWGGWWWLSGCLNWLLALLLLWLIALLLWFLLGHHNLNFCGTIVGDCECEEEVIIQRDTVVVHDTVPVKPEPKVDPKPDPKALDPCQELKSNGSNTPEQHLFNMGQIGGSFLFEYATGNTYADRIVIYDGKTKNSKIIFQYYGTTGEPEINSTYAEPGRKTVHFSGQYILIDIIPDPSPQTGWEIKVNCPK